jgi:cytochrome c oxidase assembly protein subunit 11
MSTATATANPRRNGATALVLALVVVGMVGVAYAAVPLYRLFCQVTGYGGTTQTADATPEVILDRSMTVRFNADVARGMPWRFRPAQLALETRIGETQLAFYRATNDTDETIAGHAVFNVTPLKAGIYFAKIDCFCFTEQVLRPGESADMPVSFFIDPEIADDPSLDDVGTITLSYTFFRSDDEGGPAPAAVSESARPPAGS